jgi:hypothetical protein
MVSKAGEYNDLKGKSTDTKPTDCAVNTIFLELDTGKFMYLDEDGVWKPVGGE